MKFIAVYTTVATRAEARSMAREVVKRRLAACAQICDIESVYTWHDEVRHEPECRLLFKTTSDRYAALEAAIRELHAYELPAIHAVPFERVFAPYGAWIADNSAGG